MDDFCRSVRVVMGIEGDVRHMLLECPAPAYLEEEFSSLITDCSGAMTRLVQMYYSISLVHGL